MTYTHARIETPADVIGFLTGQHREIAALLTAVRDASGDERAARFTELRRLLAVHETAEEEVVHPRARHELADGPEVVSARLREEHEAKQILADLEDLDVRSPQFVTRFDEFERAVLAHAEAEERDEFARLGIDLDDVQLERMRNAAVVAEQLAPTRSHAGVESAAANLLVGPFAAMLDRARELISGER